jgi:hypothetical protein
MRGHEQKDRFDSRLPIDGVYGETERFILFFYGAIGKSGVLDGQRRHKVSRGILLV